MDYSIVYYGNKLQHCLYSYQYIGLATLFVNEGTLLISIEKYEPS